MKRKTDNRTIIDNRMRWYLNTKKLIGVTMSWSGEPVFEHFDGTILPVRADRIMYEEFYKDGNYWPVCPITGNKIPVADHTARKKSRIGKVKTTDNR